MSKKIISAQDFIKRATRVVDIPGFDEGESFSIRIKPISLLSMMVNGKITNELLGVVMELFKDNKKASDEEITSIMLKDTGLLKSVNDMMKQVAREVMVEPKFEEIEEYLTDAQVQAIFTQAQGQIQELKPIDEE